MNLINLQIFPNLFFPISKNRHPSSLSISPNQRTERQVDKSGGARVSLTAPRSPFHPFVASPHCTGSSRIPESNLAFTTYLSNPFPPSPPIVLDENNDLALDARQLSSKHSWLAPPGCHKFSPSRGPARKQFRMQIYAFDRR